MRHGHMLNESHITIDIMLQPHNIVGSVSRPPCQIKINSLKLNSYEIGRVFICYLIDVLVLFVHSTNIRRRDSGRIGKRKKKSN